jgi:IS30 family transposase
LQTFVLLPGKKAYDADEQTRTVLGSLQLWILLGQHHQSKHRPARRHHTDELIYSEAQASEGHQEDHEPKIKEEGASSHL